MVRCNARYDQAAHWNGHSQRLYMSLGLRSRNWTLQESTATTVAQGRYAAAVPLPSEARLDRRCLCTEDLRRLRELIEAESASDAAEQSC